ncbi:hypothetical protein [Acetobacteroides hydrogenigenes]|nr:hypothetical protein [Acetobacteroides hydrogenigenes]
MTETLDSLNNFLSEPINDLMEPLNLMHTLKKNFHLQLMLVDFKRHNEELLAKTRSEKSQAVEALNFEWAANQRELERECLKYIALRDRLQLTSSTFSISKQQFVFFYFGLTKNDEVLKGLFEKMI